MFHQLIGTTSEHGQVRFLIGAKQFKIKRAELLIHRDGDRAVEYPLAWERFDGNSDLWSVTIAYMNTGLYFYRFRINGTDEIGHDEDYFCISGGDPYQLLVYDNVYSAPEWLEGGIIYQIMVDRFCAVEPKRDRTDAVYHDDWFDVPEYRPQSGKIKNNDFFGGNLKGVLSKIDYLASLHVTCLYFNPIFEAYSNHKYDTANYLKIDPAFGTEQDLSDLIDAAAARGMKIILDGVFSHTGDDSIYFNKYGRYPSVGAYQSQSSPYYGWYKFSYFPEQYQSWWGIETLPEVNEMQSSYLDFITGENGVVAAWLKKGIAGWRLDVADELPDSFIERLTERAKHTREDALVLGEVWEDASNKISYSKRREYFSGRELDSVTNYVFRSAILDYLRTGDARLLSRAVNQVVHRYPEKVVRVLMNVIGTHDTPRMLTMLSGKDASALTRDERARDKLTDSEYDRAKRKLFLAAVLQYTLPGVPCVFYGDEAGLQGHEDPFNRRCYPWDKEDGEILAFYRRLGKMRAESPELRRGAYRCLYAYGNVFIFKREDGGKRLYVGVNIGNTPFSAPRGETAYDAFTNKEIDYFSISPMSYRIMRNREG